MKDYIQINMNLVFHISEDDSEKERLYTYSKVLREI